MPRYMCMKENRMIDKEILVNKCPPCHTKCGKSCSTKALLRKHGVIP